MKKNNLDEFHWHEAFDRSYLVAEIIEDILLIHPVFNQDSDFVSFDMKKKIETAQSLILDVYSNLGKIINENDKKSIKKD